VWNNQRKQEFWGEEKGRKIYIAGNFALANEIFSAFCLFIESVKQKWIWSLECPSPAIGKLCWERSLCVNKGQNGKDFAFLTII